MIGLTKAIRSALVGTVGVIFAVFFVFFVGLMADAYGYATGVNGMPDMFTTYGYLAIEITFLILMLYGLFEVVRIGLGLKADDEMALD